MGYNGPISAFLHGLRPLKTGYNMGSVCIKLKLTKGQVAEFRRAGCKVIRRRGVNYYSVYLPSKPIRRRPIRIRRRRQPKKRKTERLLSVIKHITPKEGMGFYYDNNTRRTARKDFSQNIVNQRVEAKQKARRAKAKKKHSAPPPDALPIHEDILKSIGSLGRPFINHRKGSATYNRALDGVKKKYHRWRNEVVEIARLAQQYFNHPDFCYHPPKNIINVGEFMRYEDDEIRYRHALLRLGVKSWFDEFAKGRDHIEKKFMRVPTDENPELTRIFSNMWVRATGTIEPTQHERRTIIQIIKDFKNYVTMYSRIGDVRSLFMILDAHVLGENVDKKPYSINYFTSPNFYSSWLPKILIAHGTYRDFAEMKMERSRYLKHGGTDFFKWAANWKKEN